MRLVKISLLAATLVGSCAFAIDNVKVDGDAKFIYSTNDGVDNGPLFRKENAVGEGGLCVSPAVTADLTEGVTAGTTLYAVSTLGLYNNLATSTWTGGKTDAFWFGEAWIAGTVGNTTGKIGRMSLDTPLVFTETWAIAPNTFEAAVLVNTDITDTALVGAYIGESNDGIIGGGITDLPVNSLYSTFYQGVYAAGAVNNSWQPLTLQAWYFQAQSLLNAYWLQADLALDFGLSAGVQFTGMNYTAAGAEALAGGTEKSDNTAFSAMVAYEMKEIFSIYGAFSQTGKDDKNTLGAGTNLAGTQSKLYTEAWWNYGYVGRNDTTAFTMSATTPEELTWAKLGIYATSTTSKDGVGAGTDTKMKEVTLEAAKSFAPLDVGLYYIFADATDQNEGTSYNVVEVSLDYSF
ncbi:MAG: OprD family outer membrane porin [Thiovulaceae bacterium]|nr:OprD family outer membrane porin [Sulfurimonadaceae bacterium]